MNTSFLIAAPTSGSGKTTIARGLMALCTRKGLRVQPFKCGPDYIDTMFHTAVCGRPSVNLDTFMASHAHVRELYNYYAQEADICIVEGMMGLFDGYDRDCGSAAEIANILRLPIVLVVDARSAAYSMAALLKGFIHFRTDLQFAGVIFNRVGSQRHAQMLRDVAAEVGVTCLGCVPKTPALEQGSRYLGLDFSKTTTADELLDVLEQNLELRDLIDFPTHGKTVSHAWENSFPCMGNTYTPCLVARNAESFSFLYQETLDSIAREREVVFFDPEAPTKEVLQRLAAPVDSAEGISLLYLPGGYPEKHLTALTAASSLRQAIRDYAERGGHIVAECGGMMYLCDKIVTDDGEYPMCSVFPYAITARSADRRLSLGYRRFTLEGHEFHGHEFHYTKFADPAPVSAAKVCNAKGEVVPTAVLRKGNVWASYTHLSPESLMQTIHVGIK